MKDPQKQILTIYAIYVVSSLLQFFNETVLVGLLALVIGYILNHSKKLKEEVKNTPYDSHLRWMSRTFWIGTAVLTPLAMILAGFIVWNFTDLPSIITTMESNPEAAMGAITKDATKASRIADACMIPAVIWWIRRCWRGYELARAEMPVDDVTSWS